MSRIASAPVAIPSGVDIKVSGSRLTVKGKKGELSQDFHPDVVFEQDGDELKFRGRNASKGAVAQAGTARSLANNMVTGVHDGFERRLTLVGVGYRAQVQGKKLNLSLGFSHPVAFEPPDGISIETPSQTEVVVSGIDKQVVGQVAAKIRAYRPPEPYKGKGVRYADEQVVRKEAKKK
ncbi:MAG: 50S ribosomal protein L6 [Pseudomonadota bacterium]